MQHLKDKQQKMACKIIPDTDTGCSARANT